MSSLLTHILIPLFILLIFSEQLKLSKKVITLLSFFAIFPDIDIFHFHRSFLHNIFILIIPIIIYIFWKDIKFSFIMGYYMISHMILDTFNNGVSLLYPVYDKFLYFVIGLTYEGDIKPIFKFGIQSTMTTDYVKFPMISSENSATVLLLIIMFCILLISKHKSLNSNKKV